MKPNIYRFADIVDGTDRYIHPHWLSLSSHPPDPGTSRDGLCLQDIYRSLAD